MKSFKAIAAMAENRVIGAQGRIPWHLPDDFRWFKQTTMGGVLIMGRKTYASIGRPLPGRETVVLSRSGHAPPGVRCVGDPDALDPAGEERTHWVAGGTEIYRLLLPRCDTLYLTRVHRTVEGDAFMPPFENRFGLREIIQSGPEFDIEHWVRSDGVPDGVSPE